MPLSRDEELAYEFARRWRDESYRPQLENVDWPDFAKLLTRNRMSVLAMQVLERASIPIPAPALEFLQAQAAQYRASASQLGSALETYLQAASQEDVATIVLKGAWLCEKIYRNPAIRPGADIDILVRREKVEACLDLLRQQGIGEFWPNLLKDEYFHRHHLHQQRSSPDLKVWFEIHWALDHPYTLLTVDYEGIFRRARPGQLLGAPVREMAPPDLLLSLAIHLVKHAVYLPSLVERADLPRIILADGMLMYYLDVSETLRHYEQMDFELLIQLARQWGAVDILGSVLQVCKKYLNAPIPEALLSALPVRRSGPITRRLMARAVEQQLADYEGRPGSRFWKLLLASNGAFILRPIRALETISYFFPPADFLQRRYGDSSLITRIRHLLIASGQTMRFGWDTLYFGMERFARLKRLGKSASLSNKLETPL
jgi:hypothetical protein